jgi:hypothetical protein
MKVAFLSLRVKRLYLASMRPKATSRVWSRAKHLAAGSTQHSNLQTKSAIKSSSASRKTRIAMVA